MATIIIPNFLTAKQMVGLNTYQYTVSAAAMHLARINVTKHVNSNLTATINLNGSPVATMTVQPVDTGGGQLEQTLSATMNCAVNDVITFVLTSSASSDQQLNSVKSTLNIHVGSSN
jgi:hypothetical protein